MTLKYNNSYINEVSTVAGPYVIYGPFKYDETFTDYYDNEETFEKCEIKNYIKCIKILLGKCNKSDKDIDLIISSDLLNQLMISNFMMNHFNIPFFGVYNACASFCEELILASTLIDSKKMNNIITATSSNNLTAERQYRNPVEYGYQKKMYQTFTVTGSASCLISNKKSNIKITTATIGKVVDFDVKDSLNMGKVMAPSAYETFITHLKELNLKPEYYDLILTGDLGKYGKTIFNELFYKNFGYYLSNYEDSACMIYDNNDKRVLAGGSGIACINLVTNSYVIPQMISKKYKRVLLIATGALMSVTSVNQKMSIPSISHAVSLEVI